MCLFSTLVQWQHCTSQFHYCLQNWRCVKYMKLVSLWNKLQCVHLHMSLLWLILKNRAWRKNTVTHGLTSPWSSDKCVRFDAGRSRVRLLARSYQDHVNWYCSFLTMRTVCRRAAGNTPRTQKQTEWNETRNCTNSVVALLDHCSYKVPTTNHHIKKKFPIDHGRALQLLLRAI